MIPQKLKDEMTCMFYNALYRGSKNIFCAYKGMEVAAAALCETEEAWEAYCSWKERMELEAEEIIDCPM